MCVDGITDDMREQLHALRISTTDRRPLSISALTWLLELILQKLNEEEKEKLRMQHRRNTQMKLIQSQLVLRTFNYLDKAQQEFHMLQKHTLIRAFHTCYI